MPAKVGSSGFKSPKEKATQLVQVHIQQYNHLYNLALVAVWSNGNLSACVVSGCCIKLLIGKNTSPLEWIWWCMGFHTLELLIIHSFYREKKLTDLPKTTGFTDLPVWHYPEPGELVECLMAHFRLIMVSPRRQYHGKLMCCPIGI